MKYWDTGDDQLCRKRFGEGGRVVSLLDMALAGMNANQQRKKNIFGRIRKGLTVRRKK